MKLIFIATLFTFILSAFAAGLTPNGARLARGMSPLRPARLYADVASRTAGAKRATPSSTSGQCNTGELQCCQQTGTVSGSNGGLLGGLLSLLGIEGIADDLLLGANCSPLSIIGLGGNSCSASPVCCENNSYDGLISIGCVPITINL